MPERQPALRAVVRLAWCCLSAGVLVAALIFPIAAVIGLFSNRAADVVANGSAQLVEGDVPQVSTMVDAAGNPIALKTSGSPSTTAWTGRARSRACPATSLATSTPVVA